MISPPMLLDENTARKAVHFDEILHKKASFSTGFTPVPPRSEAGLN